MRALVDGDVLRYRVGFACEKKYIDVFVRGEEAFGPLATFDSKTEYNKWIKDVHGGDSSDFVVEERIVPDPVENCLHSVKLQMESIINGCGATSYTVYLSGGGNYRETLVDYYKANRKDSPKPVHYGAITDYLISRWGAVVIEGQEADDALGIDQMETVDERTCICSIDKDLDNIPGRHYNFVKDERYKISYDQARVNFYAQVIKGDTADNIPGLFKIAGVRAMPAMFEPLAYMDNDKDMFEHVLDVYVKAFFPEDGETFTEYRSVVEAVWHKLRETGKLLWIRWYEDEDWEPPVSLEEA